jgi:hypothetical protein
MVGGSLTTLISYQLMNAEKYVTTKPIWIEATSEIRGLDDKSIVIIDSEEGEMRANLRLNFESDPSRTDTRKCSVVVWRSQVDEKAWGGRFGVCEADDADR